MSKLDAVDRRVGRRFVRLLSATALTAATCMVALVAPRPVSAEVTITQQLAVPSYIHPNALPADWTQLSTSTPGSVGIAVANVINGPDYTPLAEWSSVIHAVHANGVRVIGYVDTGYLGTTGQRTRLGSSRVVDWISQIQRDIDAWYAFYGDDVTGIFFDQGQNSCGPTATSNEWADLYAELNRYVKRAHPGALTVLNPGIIVPQCYEHTADVLVTFEGSYESYTSSPASATPYTPLGWDPVDPMKIWHIVYGATTVEQMSNVMAISKTRSAGYMYVTDDVMANPYDRLPPVPYWVAEQAIALSRPPIPLIPPTTPGTLDSVDYSGTTIDIDWEASTGLTAPVVAYDIFRDGVWIGSVPATSTAYRAEGLAPTTYYTFTVTARDALGVSSVASNVLTEHTDETYGIPPSAPNNVVASGTGYTSTVLSWKPTRGRVPVAAYLVLQNGTPVLRLPSSATSVTVGKLAPGASYQFSIVTVDETGGQSRPSRSVDVSTPALPAGGMISNVLVATQPDAITLSADYLVPFAFRRAFIATGDPTRPCWSTGSEPQMCADYVIENDRLLRYVGSGTDWDWAVVRAIEPVVTGSTYAWVISAFDLGTTSEPIVVFNANGYAPNSYCGTAFVCTATGPPLPYE